MTVQITAVAALATVLCLASLPSLGSDPRVASGGALTVNDPTRYNLAQPGTPLPTAVEEKFFAGRALFRQSWVVAPGFSSEFAGLGPIYNQIACAACHMSNGRGAPTARPDEPMKSMVVLLNAPGTDANGGANVHPVYGGQFLEHAIPGVPPAGRVAISWEDSVQTLPDGEVVPMRRPLVAFPELNYGPLGSDTLVSMRVAPQILGLGLIDAVADETILGLVQKGETEGVHGRVSMVWDGVNNRRAIGRFGRAAGTASLKEMVYGSFTADFGLTSPFMPNKNCTPTQTACKAVPPAGNPEISQERLDAVLTYYLALGVPARRDLDNPAVQKGERLFGAIGCDACHVPTMRTGTHAIMPQLSDQVIHPYSDLLLHDMGDALADGAPGFSTSQREWRTAPLWGVGVAGMLNGNVNYLHDGRARTLAEAILWHDGDGAASRDAFRKLPKDQRDAVIAFMQSL